MRHSICGLVFCWATSSSKSHHFQICVLSVSYRIPFELVIDLEHKFAARSDWLMNFHISICLLELILSDPTAPFKASYYCWNERLKIALPSRRVSNDVHFRKTHIWSKLTLIFSVLMWHFVFMRSQHWSAKVHLIFNKYGASSALVMRDWDLRKMHIEYVDFGTVLHHCLFICLIDVHQCFQFVNSTSYLKLLILPHPRVVPSHCKSESTRV